MRPHVLVVDDEAALCEMLSLYLAHKGFLVTTASTIEQAIERLEQNSFAFNLVILDLNLAGRMASRYCASPRPEPRSFPSLSLPGGRR
jgi:DNA-binding response OmpR family regulator